MYQTVEGWIYRCSGKSQASQNTHMPLFKQRLHASLLATLPRVIRPKSLFFSCSLSLCPLGTCKVISILILVEEQPESASIVK